MRKNESVRKLWGGRFAAKSDPAIERYTASLRFDWRLAPYDLCASMAHARMLGQQRIIRRVDAHRLVAGLQRLAKTWESHHPACQGAEDIHSWIQAKLEEAIGPTARLLQTGRSRNDQVVTAVRLYCLDHGRAIGSAIAALERQLVTLAEEHVDVVMPGYTHLQRAQPVLVAHHLVAYVEMLERDRARLFAALDRMNVFPGGSGALSGIGLPLNQPAVAKALGFRSVTTNSLDAVSDRDFLMELVSTLAIVMMHLSRLAGDVILWSTAEFGFVRLDEAVLTGSSLMPQKRNPDPLELIRGGAAKVIADVAGLLALAQGLPLGYHRDLQRDKEFLFDAVELAATSVQAMTRCLQGLRFQGGPLAEALTDPGLYATDLADYLVRHGVSFAQAHETVGRLLRYCDEERIELRVAALDVFWRFDKRFGPDVHRLFQPSHSVGLKRTIGGTAPHHVRQAIRRLKARLPRELTGGQAKLA